MKIIVKEYYEKRSHEHDMYRLASWLLFKIVSFHCFHIWNCVKCYRLQQVLDAEVLTIQSIIFDSGAPETNTKTGAEAGTTYCSSLLARRANQSSRMMEKRSMPYCTSVLCALPTYKDLVSPTSDGVVKDVALLLAVDTLPPVLCSTLLLPDTKDFSVLLASGMGRGFEHNSSICAKLSNYWEISGNICVIGNIMGEKQHLHKQYKGRGRKMKGVQ